MAVCRSCGAELRGAYCTACGNAAGRPGPAAQQAARAREMGRQTSPVIWALIALLSVAIATGAAAGVAVAVVAGKTGLTAAEIIRHPAYAVARLAMAAEPDYEEISHTGGSITIRNRRTGRRSTLRFGEMRGGGFHMWAENDDGGTAGVEMGGGERTLPAWVPLYPGADAAGGITAMGDEGEKRSAGGTVAYLTQDSVADVTAFYESKADAAGMSIDVKPRNGHGAALVLRDAGKERRLAVSIGEGPGRTTIALTYAGKE